jgi:hypothetical protein
MNDSWLRGTLRCILDSDWRGYEMSQSEFQAVGLKPCSADDRDSIAQYLQHEPYISTLPTTQELLTPFQWNEVELSLLEGLNLGHAVAARRELWRREWEELGRALEGVEGVTVDW